MMPSEVRNLTEEEKRQIEADNLGSICVFIVFYLVLVAFCFEALSCPEDIPLQERKRLNEGLRRRMQNPTGSLISVCAG